MSCAWNIFYRARQHVESNVTLKSMNAKKTPTNFSELRNDNDLIDGASDGCRVVLLIIFV